MTRYRCGNQARLFFPSGAFCSLACEAGAGQLTELDELRFFLASALWGGQITAAEEQ